MLGSFPPQRKRWSMEFFYPNLQNDMWRVVGYLATGDKQHFLTQPRTGNISTANASRPSAASGGLPSSTRRSR